MKTRRVSLNVYFILTRVPGELFLAIGKDRILGCTRKGKSLGLCSTNTEVGAKKWLDPWKGTLNKRTMSSLILRKAIYPRHSGRNSACC